MIFVTTMCIGLAAALTRSAASITVCALALLSTLTLAAFAAATLSVSEFLSAIAGYNSGLFAFVLLLLAGWPSATTINNRH